MKIYRNCLLLLILCLSVLFAAGCRNQSEVRNADETIRLSNILFEGMDMNTEQEKALQTAKALNAGVAFDEENYLLTAVNTSDQPVNIEFYLVMYNEQGDITGSYWKWMDEWRVGQEVSLLIDNAVKAARIELASEIECGDTYVRTGFSELNTSSQEQAVRVSFANKLPATIRIDDTVYTFSDFAFYPSGSYSYGQMNYTCEFKLTKVSGPDDSTLDFSFRFVGEDGIVYENESCRGGYMEEGETLLVRSVYIQLPEGNYKMEVFGDNIRAAA